MGNSNITLAKDYHEGTKHSPLRVREANHLDLENKPQLYKVYSNLASIELPRNFPHPMKNTISCVGSFAANTGTINMATLAELLYFSAGITKTIRFPSGAYDFRAAACTGGLYEVETYIVCRDIPDLAAGVYHFNPRDFALQQLRAGDFRPFLYEAAGYKHDVLSASFTVVLSAIYWRNTWKYQARAYRHFFWDSGTILANLLATAGSANLTAEVILGFVDDSVNHLLGLTVNEETTTAIVPIGSKTSETHSLHKSLEPIPPLSYEYVPLSKKQVNYPEVLKIHHASALRSPQEVKSWLSHPAPNLKMEYDYNSYSLQEAESEYSKPLGKTIIRRGSTRRFAREPIQLSYLSTILRSSTTGIQADFLKPRGSTLVEIYLITNAVDGLQAGAYYYDRTEQTLKVLKLGDFRDTAAYLCLEQALGLDGSVALFLMSTLDSVLGAYGNRGYRAAQLEAGILLGKMNLCAYALGIGASGITFYDDAITDFFSPHAAGKCNMLSVILGVPAYGYGKRTSIK